jgi:hypothetical protein
MQHITKNLAAIILIWFLHTPKKQFRLLRPIKLMLLIQLKPKNSLIVLILTRELWQRHLCQMEIAFSNNPLLLHFL